ncbi:hypothetical protein, partial [Oscillibacter ruminantium]|uniref:hypothetical protein n=1 Tax=Oscillibacter ruminantium TaxID=1263547 RepID=UPI00332932B2
PPPPPLHLCHQGSQLNPCASCVDFRKKYGQIENLVKITINVVGPVSYGDVSFGFLSTYQKTVEHRISPLPSCTQIKSAEAASSRLGF